MGGGYINMNYATINVYVSIAYVSNDRMQYLQGCFACTCEVSSAMWGVTD